MFVTPKAHAVLFCHWVADEVVNFYHDSVDVGFCVIFLPICLFDEKSQVVQSQQLVSIKSLVANGLKREKANDFFRQNQELAKSMAKLNENFQAKTPGKILTLTVGKKDNKQSLAKEIVSIYPQATKDFVDFYTTQIMAL